MFRFGLRGVCSNSSGFCIRPLPRPLPLGGPAELPDELGNDSELLCSDFRLTPLPLPPTPLTLFSRRASGLGEGSALEKSVDSEKADKSDPCSCCTRRLVGLKTSIWSSGSR